MAVIEHPVNTPEAWSARAASGEQWDACGWSRHGQDARLTAVARALRLQRGDRVLDYGCGTARLVEFLLPDTHYFGFDYAAGMRDRARRDHPGTRILEAVSPVARFDAVACVGVFNLPGRWSKERTFHTLRWLWDTTGCRTLVASLYAGDDPNCLQYGLRELIRCGRDLSYFHHVERILPNDLMLSVRRVG